MSIPDFAMGSYFRLVTRWSSATIQDLEEGMTSGKYHPRDVKMKLAREITEIFYGEQAALEAEQNFVRVFQQGGAPEEMPVYQLQAGQTVLDVLLAAKMVGSKSEGRRLIEQQGVRLDGETLNDAAQPFPHAGILQVGKRRFLRVVE